MAVSDTDMEVISPGIWRRLAEWHFNQPSQSFLTNEYVSVWPKRACVIFPSFYHKDAGRHSRGIRSTLCGDRQTGSANKMECLCISHLSVNIQIHLPTGAVCVCVHLWYMKDCVWMISYLTGIDDNSTGPPDPLVLVTIIIHPLTIAHLLHNRLLVAASPMGSLTCVKGRLILWWR